MSDTNVYYYVLIMGLLSTKLGDAIGNQSFIFEILFLILIYGKMCPKSIIYWKIPIVIILTKIMIDIAHPLSSYFISQIVDLINENSIKVGTCELNYLSRKFNFFIILFSY